jgi:hypothetical protein
MRNWRKEYVDSEKVIVSSKDDGWEKEKFEFFLKKYVLDN